jgi:phage shock protein A
MGIIDRFKEIMAANFNALLDKAEDPEKMIDQYMRNLEEDLAKVKSETASVMADEKNAQRKVSKSAMAHKAENDSFKSAILAALADGTTKKACDLATALNVSTQKISALAKQLVDCGAITVSDVKVKGKGTVKGYTLVIAEDGEDIAEDGEDGEDTAE